MNVRAKPIAESKSADGKMYSHGSIGVWPAALRMPLAPSACSSSCARTAVSALTTMVFTAELPTSKPGTPLVMLLSRLEKKATSKSSLKAMSSNMVTSPSWRVGDSAPLGRVPCACCSCERSVINPMLSNFMPAGGEAF